MEIAGGDICFCVPESDASELRRRARELYVCWNIAAPPLCSACVLLSLPASERAAALVSDEIMDFRARTVNRHRRSFYFSCTHGPVVIWKVPAQ
jgi:hypothetical protein